MGTAADDIPTAILGRPVHARLRSAALAAWLREHWHYPAHALAPNAFAVTLEEVEPGAAPRVTDGEPVPATLPGIRLELRHSGGAWLAGDRDAGVRLQLAHDGAEIVVWGADREDGRAPFAALYVAICEALRASGLVPLHAAVASPPEGGAVALLGPSGTGKSTTLLRLVAAGWTPIAEDLSWLDPTDSVLYGWDRGVRLWPGTAERFIPGLAAAPWRAGPDGKRFLDWRVLGAPERRAARLTALVLITRDPAAATAWEPLPAREAVRALWEAVGVPLSERGRAVTAAAAPTLVSGPAWWRLRLGAGEIPARLPAD
jgi:hypothetical protein